MKRNVLAIALVAVGLMWSACDGKQKKDGEYAEGVNTESEAAASRSEVDAAEEEEVDAPRRGIESIREVWAGKPIKVNRSNTVPDILQYAKAFCQTFPQCETNKALKEFLTSPDADKNECQLDLASQDGEHTISYRINSNPRNGYIRCMAEVQTDRFTYVCYWNRKDGHKLVAAFMDECWESPSWDQCLVVFYDYNPTTDTMTPEPALTSMIEKRMKKYDVYSVELPEEGKDIEVLGFTIDEEEDSGEYDELKLKWNGQTFDWND